MFKMCSNSRTVAGPKNVHDKKGFVRRCSYFGYVFKDFGKKGRPQQMLLQRGTKFIWSTEHQGSTTEREYLAESLWQAVHGWNGSPFTWILGLKKGSGWLTRWTLRLQECDVTIKYKNWRKLQKTTHKKESILIGLHIWRKLSEEQRKGPNLKQIVEALNSSQNVKGDFGIIYKALRKRNLRSIVEKLAACYSWQEIFIYIKNKSGPKIEPCRTPTVITPQSVLNVIYFF